jgi:hypothetical protein
MPKKQSKEIVSSESESESESDSHSDGHINKSHIESDSDSGSGEDTQNITSTLVSKEGKTFTERYNDALDVLQESQIQQMKALKSLASLSKKAFKESSKRKQKRNPSGEPRKPTGFLAPKQVPIKIRKYLGGIESDEELSQNEISKRIHIKLKEDNRVEGSKIFITNKIAMKTFGVEKEYETSFIGIKKIISSIYKESVEA